MSRQPLRTLPVSRRSFPLLRAGVVEQPDAIAKVNWIRLGSVTHSFDQNQRMNTLAFKKGPGTLTVTAPENANICPPGHYMLFVVDERASPQSDISLGSRPVLSPRRR